MIPPAYEFLLLAAIAYRGWRLLAEDSLLDKPRMWLVGLPRDWEEGDSIPKGYRNELAKFVNCPWCLGAWVSLATYVGWMLTIGDTPDSVSAVFIAVGIWFALSCAVGIIRAKLDPPE